MSSEEPIPSVTEVIDGAVAERMRGVDPEEGEDTSWELGFLIEGLVYDLILDHLPRGTAQNLIEQVLDLVDWPRQAELSTWRHAEKEETVL